MDYHLGKFRFLRKPDSSISSYYLIWHTACIVRENIPNKWSLLQVRNHASKNRRLLPKQGHSLLHFRNLVCTPPTFIKDPSCVDKAINRPLSEECRVTSKPMLQQIIRLGDQASSSCSELSHWDIKDYIELSCIGKYLMQKTAIYKTKKTIQGNCVGLVAGNVSDDTTNSSAAKLSSASGEGLFFGSWK